MDFFKTFGYIVGYAVLLVVLFIVVPYLISTNSTLMVIAGVIIVCLYLSIVITTIVKDFKSGDSK